MWGTIFALRKATVMRTKILSVTPINPLGVTAPLVNKGSRERAPSPSVRHKGAEAAAAASHRFTKVRVAVKPADGGLPSSVTVRHSAAPCHLPQGGRQGRLPPQSADIAAVRTAAALPQAEQRLFSPKEKAFPRINSRFLLHRGVYSVIIHLIIRKMRRKDYLYERKEKTPRRPL